MPTLIIQEEYGYRYWVAVLTPEEYEALKARWCTMRGLNCLVPVPLIITQAVETSLEHLATLTDEETLHCHIHESGDSGLEGVTYTIPGDTDFSMEGKSYDDNTLLAMARPRE